MRILHGCIHNKLDVRGSVPHSTILTEKPNKMQQCIKLLLIPILNEAQHVSGDTPPIIRSLKLHRQPLVLHNTVEGCRTSDNLPQHYAKPEAACLIHRCILLGFSVRVAFITVTQVTSDRFTVYTICDTDPLNHEIIQAYASINYEVEVNRQVPTSFVNLSLIFLPIKFTAIPILPHSAGQEVNL